MCVFLMGCQTESTNTTAADVSGNAPNAAQAQVADLLPRGEKIQLGKEWEQVHNFYSKQKLAVQNDPQDHASRLAIMELFIREARVTGEHGHYYPAALQLANTILEDEGLEPDIRFRTLTNKGGVQLSLHQFKEALATAQKAARLNPLNAQVQGVLVDCYVELGQYDKAVAAADRMISIKPDIRSYSRISYLREIHGDVDGAVKALELAIKSGFPAYEETAWAMLTLGDLYLRYDQADKAEKVYREILKVRPDYPFAVAALGEIAYRKGDLDTAEETIREAIDIIPEVGFYVQLAQLQKDRGQQEAFQATIDEIMLMLADDEEAGHNMNLEYTAIYRDLVEDLDAAVVYANKEYEKRPENIDVNRVMAGLAFKQDRFEAARQHLESAQKTSSAHPELTNLGNQLSNYTMN